MECANCTKKPGPIPLFVGTREVLFRFARCNDGVSTTSATA